MFLHNPETDYVDHEYLDNKDIPLKWNPKFDLEKNPAQRKYISSINKY